jgi:hypothetical protein
VFDAHRMFLNTLHSRILRLYYFRTLISGFLFVYFFLLWAGSSFGEETKKEGKFDINYDLFSDKREISKEIVDNYSIFRSYQDIEFNLDKSVVAFMLDHPVFLAVTLKVMKIKNYSIKKDTDGGYIVDDLKGVSGRVEVIYSADGQKYFYGAGGYKGPLFKFSGIGLILFEYRGAKGNPSRAYVSANTYTKLDNVVLEFFVKIINFILKPLMKKKINKFITETQELAKEIERHPGKVYLAIKESGLADEAELEEFKKLVF